MKITIIKVFFRIAVNTYVPIFRGLDARGGRKLQTHTHTHTHTRDNYSSPRCTHVCRWLITPYTRKLLVPQLIMHFLFLTINMSPHIQSCQTSRFSGRSPVLLVILERSPALPPIEPVLPLQLPIVYSRSVDPQKNRRNYLIIGSIFYFLTPRWSSLQRSSFDII